MEATSRISRDYNILKGLAFKYFKKEDYLESLNKISQSAKFAYTYNATDEFGDSALDNLLTEIAKREISSISLEQASENRVVFYDYFAWDNRGLTQQYLTALENLGYEILFLTRFELTNKSSKDILAQIDHNVNITHYTIKNQSNDIEAAKEVLEQIEMFKPSKAFLHLSPWDIAAFLSFSRLENQLTRYFINLTDHTFWLGNNIIDFCLEFRNFGYQLSVEHRKIPIEKCIIIPYYPIIQPECNFEGLPEASKGKVIGISGGSGYKFMGEKDGYYKLIQPLLIKHKNLCFIIVGAKETESHFISLAQKDKIAEQLIFLENRNDISQLIKNCSFFLCSFPLTGGLITQMAAQTGVPILSYSTPELSCNFIEDLIPYHDKKFKSFTNLEEFQTTASKIIEDENFRKMYSSYTDQRLIDVEKFNDLIRSLMKEGLIIETIAKDKIKFNRKKFTSIMFEQKSEKEYINSFNSLFSFKNIFNLNLFTSIYITFHKLRLKAERGLLKR